MDTGRKILLIVGGAFAGLGLIVGLPLGILAFLGMVATRGSIFGGLAVLLGMLSFLIIGIIMIATVMISYAKEKEVREKGTRYPAKIYSYVEDKSLVVNDDFLVNVKVHYFDSNGEEREAIIPTKFSKGTAEYPIGMTIDIFEYKGRYNFDKSSVRAEVLDREDELMDDKPIDRAGVKLIAITCSNCGASFEAVQGYTAKCPYCSSVMDA